MVRGLHEMIEDCCGETGDIVNWEFRFRLTEVVGELKEGRELETIEKLEGEANSSFRWKEKESLAELDDTIGCGK